MALPEAAPSNEAGGPGLFSPSQINGGLQTTITRVVWGADSDIASIDPGSEWADVTVVISVQCILINGCQNLSVMDYDLVYDKFTGVVIDGAQQEFALTNLAPYESTWGSITFAVLSTATSFTLRYEPKPIAVAEFSK